MSVGLRIARLRQDSGKTQQQVCDATGLAVAYLSRVENDRIAPTVRTLQKVARALGVSPTAFFETGTFEAAPDQCPVSLSGRCILDHPFAGRGRPPKKGAEKYSAEQLKMLRMCNFLLHSGTRETQRALGTMLRSLVALTESRA